MNLSTQTRNTVRLLKRIATDLKLRFCARDTAIDLMSLALLCQEHVLLLGPPGTGKSELVSRFSSALQARTFHYLLTRFTEPAELFGPIDLEAFRSGSYRMVTRGMLPEAQVAFLDEVFQASSAILNTLLTLVHERLFINGEDKVTVPLMTLFGATNTLPEDPTLRAFSDRFVLRLEVEPVPDALVDELLLKGWEIEVERLEGRANDRSASLTPDMLGQAGRDLRLVDASTVQLEYQTLVRRLRAEGVELSERRLIKGLKLIRGAALLDGRDRADNRDLWPLNHMWNTVQEIEIIRDVVQPAVDEAGGPSLNRGPLLENILDDLAMLEGRQPESEGALLAHLSSLAQIRRQVRLYHVAETELLGRVEAATQLAMNRLQSGFGA